MECATAYLLLLIVHLQAGSGVSILQFSVTDDSSVFRTLYYLSVENCRKECSARPLCVSINYFRLSRSCDLNKMAPGSPESTRGLKRHVGYIHSKKSDWKDSIYSSCTCVSGQKCISTNDSCVFAECEKSAVHTRANMLTPGAKSDGDLYCMRDLSAVHSFGAGLKPSTVPYRIQTCGSDGNWKITRPPSEPCYVIALTMVPATNQDPYIEWKDGKTSLNEPSHTRPYRSHVIDTWEIFPVTRVRLSIYRHLREVKYVIFNGTGSSYLDWFSAFRVIDSSWQDLSTLAVVTDSTQKGYYFSLIGIDSGKIVRRFYIKLSFSGCNLDSGWFTAVVKGRCEWERNNVTNSKFLYSTLDVAGVFHTDSEMADYVYVVLCIGNC